MINFVTTDRVPFEVAIANAAKAGIHLNARLLSVAIRVRKGELEPFPEDIIVAGRTTELRALRDWRLEPPQL